jgi:hypothetical protein
MKPEEKGEVIEAYALIIFSSFWHGMNFPVMRGDMPMMSMVKGHVTDAIQLITAYYMAKHEKLGAAFSKWVLKEFEEAYLPFHHDARDGLPYTYIFRHR